MIASLEDHFEVRVITQNVDDLHQQAGSSRVLHLHGELKKVRSTFDETLVYDWTEDLNIGDLCDDGHQLRPHIVWFGEAVPMLPEAIHQTKQADIVIIIGTSLQVYPAASLFSYAKSSAPVYYVDPAPASTMETESRGNFETITDTAVNGVPALAKRLIDQLGSG